MFLKNVSIFKGWLSKMDKTILSKARKIALVSVGFLSLFLGIAGIFLPVLPTTPFLLVSAWAFLRTSQRLFHWLVNHKLLGRYIRDYLIHKKLPVKTKLISIVTLWAVILTTAMFLVENVLVKILLLIIAIGVTLHLLAL
ncbi:MAG: YbaN family protein [Fervidobacterium sp.]|nr:YbaN family protein [Fervidobacterium sp.]